MSLVICHFHFFFTNTLQIYKKYPKVGAKIIKNSPKYHPKTKVGAKKQQFQPKVGAKIPQNSPKHHPKPKIGAKTNDFLLKIGVKKRITAKKGKDFSIILIIRFRNVAAV